MASESVPSTMQAIIHVGDGTASVAQSHPVPKLRDSYMLVKVDSIALNPTDWKHISNKMGCVNGISGCDYSGTVIKVGPSVTKSFSPGDRVAGTAHGANQDEPEDGCFAQYAMVKGDLQVKIPDDLSFEKAATFPLGVATVAQGLFQKALKLNLPTNPTKSGEWVLIYGGSSATGSLGVQFAKLAGYKVVSTASPRNHDFVRSLGADEVFDYNDSECASKIKKLTNDSLKLCWDTISLEGSAKICADAISSSGGQYGSIVPVKVPRDDVTNVWTLMYTIFNEKFHKGEREFPASQEDFEFAKMLFDITEDLLKQSKLKTHPEKVGEKGLEGALQGMRDMKNEKVSGQKLVYKVADTPKNSQAKTEFE